MHYAVATACRYIPAAATLAIQLGPNMCQLPSMAALGDSTPYCHLEGISHTIDQDQRSVQRIPKHDFLASLASRPVRRCVPPALAKKGRGGVRLQSGAASRACRGSSSARRVRAAMPAAAGGPALPRAGAATKSWSKPWRMTGRQRAAGAGPPLPVDVGRQFRAPGESGLFRVPYSGFGRVSTGVWCLRLSPLQCS